MTKLILDYDTSHHVIRLWLNPKEYFSIHLQVSLEQLGVGHYGTIFFHDIHDMKYKLFTTKSTLWTAVGDLESYIKDTLLGKRELHRLYTKGLGYEFNQDQHKKLNGLKKLSWDGSNYLLWDTYDRPCTWLYSETGMFYFAITPLYLKKMYHVSYKVFIKNYHPYIVRMVTANDLERLLTQISELAIIMRTNTNRWRTLHGY